MLNKLTWFIAYKYLTSRHENGFISFSTAVSAIGVAIGICVLIVVLSVLDGFREHVEYKLLQDQTHIIINSNDKAQAQHISDKFSDVSELGIIESYPLIYDKALLKFQNNALPIEIVSEANIDQIQKDKSSRLNPNLIISDQLAQNLNLKINSTLILAAPIMKNSIVGPQPRFKKFIIAGFFNKLDKKYLASADIIMPYDTAVRFYELPDNYITGLYLYINKPLMTEKIKQDLYNKNLVANNVAITTWQDNNQTLFQAIRLERIAIVILLIIIIAVACFNILSGLFIQVAEKQKDIAVLKTLGATKQDISNIFILQGVLIALFGGVLGVILGSMVTISLDSILHGLQNMSLISQTNTFFLAITSHTIAINLNIFEVFMIFVVALLLCILATIIPALKSSKTLPLEAFRNE